MYVHVTTEGYDTSVVNFYIYVIVKPVQIL